MRDRKLVIETDYMRRSSVQVKALSFTSVRAYAVPLVAEIKNEPD